ncbi:ATP-binding protein [Streptomyces sp. PKU-EA00015]|uniref:ATP-binding protein n=1 Tax=Streptomyces sp. PKU-EA00015 TaxID=2748326 RepID=UPI0015A13EEE|nr:ATP-binding protein [Streptomyces sp. PKU-EA00015]NWF29597.1 ATP-binding protein [Streptomyces sp. PKU-EA00015]
MKHSAKTLGVAALGAAFAAAGAGTASAAPALPDTTGALGAVSQLTPVQEVAAKLPAGAPQSLAGGQAALAKSTAVLPGALQQTTGKVLSTDDAAAPVSGLIGGLKTGELSGGLLPGGLAG